MWLFGYYHFCDICFKRIITRIEIYAINMSNWLIIWLVLVSQILANFSVLRMFNFKRWCWNIIWKTIFGTLGAKCANPVARSMTLPIWSSLDPTLRWSSLTYTLRWHKGQKLPKPQPQLVQSLHFNWWQSTMTQNVLIRWILHYCIMGVENVFQNE